MLREQCWDELLLPLMTSVLSIAGQHAVSVEGSSLLTLVRVDDVLRACGCFRPSEPLKIYGFGCIGGVRGLFADQLDRVLRINSAFLCVDEVAVSVIHDMIFSFAVTIIKNAVLNAKVITSAPPAYHDERRNEQLFLSEVVIANLAATLPLKVLQTSTEEPPSNLTSSLTREPLQVITVKHVIDALKACLSGDLLSYACNTVDETIERFDLQRFTHSTVSSEATLGSASRLQLSPEILWFALTSTLLVGEKAFTITMDALIGLTAACEYLSIEIFELSGTKCKEQDDSEFKCITAEHVCQAIRSDPELDLAFPGVIRQGGFDTDLGWLQTLREQEHDTIAIIRKRVIDWLMCAKKLIENTLQIVNQFSIP
jgi:hypothetical protein